MENTVITKYQGMGLNHVVIRRKFSNEVLGLNHVAFLKKILL